ncbi:MAG: hypothetical protein M3Q10_12070 [Chloroflexota bacterium]|nr:hypothetical protein [Chloroflexota bacterium]
MNNAVARDEGVFQPDGFGSLRDVYVLDTDSRDWQHVLDHLRQSEVPLAFHVDGQPRPLPTDIQAIFRLRDAAVVGLAIDLTGVLVRCHFFTPSEIEFDFDPRDVVRPEQADRVLSFLQELADLLGKPVLLEPVMNFATGSVRSAPIHRRSWRRISVRSPSEPRGLRAGPSSAPASGALGAPGASQSSAPVPKVHNRL